MQPQKRQPKRLGEFPYPITKAMNREYQEMSPQMQRYMIHLIVTEEMYLRHLSETQKK